MHPERSAAHVHIDMATLNTHDMVMIEQLSDDNAAAADPTGSAEQQGIVAIKTLYERTFTLNISARLTSGLRISGVNVARRSYWGPDSLSKQ